MATLLAIIRAVFLSLLFELPFDMRRFYSSTFFESTCDKLYLVTHLFILDCLNYHFTFYISTSFESSCDKLYIVTNVFIFDPPLHARMKLYLKHHTSESRSTRVDPMLPLTFLTTNFNRPFIIQELPTPYNILLSFIYV